MITNVYDDSNLIDKVVMPEDPPYKPDYVNHPPHYISGRKYEPIDVIADWDLSFCLGNALKYISRAGRKDDTIQDLKKAIWYLEKEIHFLEKEEYHGYAALYGRD